MCSLGVSGARHPSSFSRQLRLFPSGRTNWHFELSFVVVGQVFFGTTFFHRVNVYLVVFLVTRRLSFLLCPQLVPFHLFDFVGLLGGPFRRLFGSIVGTG